MNVRLAANALLVVLILSGVFGLYVPIANHGEHGAGCMFASGEIALCGVPLFHLQHWISAFTAVLVELVLLFAFLVFTPWFDIGSREKQYERYRFTQRTPVRPTLMQELFSRGILNRKESSLTL